MARAVGIDYLDQRASSAMTDSGTASSSSSSTRLSLSSSVKKRTISDAGLDDTAGGDGQNQGKRVVVFEAFKLFDVQSAVNYRSRSIAAH